MRQNVQPLNIPIDYNGKITIVTQQGMSQHTLTLSVADAVKYTNLLNKYDQWWADITNFQNNGNNLANGLIKQ